MTVENDDTTIDLKEALNMNEKINTIDRNVAVLMERSDNTQRFINDYMKRTDKEIENLKGDNEKINKNMNDENDKIHHRINGLYRWLLGTVFAIILGAILKALLGG
ncbi:MAG: hypothetical protein KAW12_07315 [Candidatus Aminicenantes bacterium]|nr:hypothetical protein [Candidatus Aminicenantes bacterium]